MSLAIGSVVRALDGRGIGVVTDAWPLVDPRGVSVRWEPLLSGRVSTCDPAELVVVPLVDTTLPV